MSTTSPTFVTNAQTVPNDGSVFPVATGIDGAQYVSVDLDHNFVSESFPTPVIPADGSLAGLVSDGLGLFQAGMDYSLTVNLGLNNALSAMDVGLVLGSGAPSLADVLAGNASADFASVLFNGSQFSNDALQTETLTLDTTSHPDLVGQEINISLVGISNFEYGRQVLFDNVSLTSSSATPEPSSLIMICAGALLFFTARALPFAKKQARAARRS